MTKRVTALTKEVTKALTEHGEGSREVRNAESLLRVEERRLARAQHRAAEFERREAMTPSEIVDAATRRRPPVAASDPAPADHPARGPVACTVPAHLRPADGAQSAVAE